jgi:photosystem II stability/assembly factor-like uncharacterized protein
MQASRHPRRRRTIAFLIAVGAAFASLGSSSAEGTSAQSCAVRGGPSWHRLGLSSPLFPNVIVFRNACHGAIGGLAGNHAAIRVTWDGGLNWRTARLPSGLAEVLALAFGDARHALALAGTQDAQPVLLASGDGGATWRHQRIPRSGGLWGLSMAGHSAWLVGESNRQTALLLSSANGGRTWVQAALPRGLTDLGGSVLRSNGHGWLMAWGHGGTHALFTTDFGRTWLDRPVALGVMLFGISTPDDRSVLVGGRTGQPHARAFGSLASVYATADNGRHWRRLQTPVSRATRAVLTVGTAQLIVVQLLKKNLEDALLVRAHRGWRREAIPCARPCAVYTLAASKNALWIETNRGLFRRKLRAGLR